MQNLFLNIAIGALVITCGSILLRSKRKAKLFNTKGAGNYRKKPLYDNDPEKLLYRSVLEQLGGSYHIQFGTSLSALVQGPKKTPNAVIDILIMDAFDFTPKLAVLVAPGGSMWALNANINNSNALNIDRVLNEAGIRVITQPKQDFYNKGEYLVSDILDALREID